MAAEDKAAKAKALAAKDDATTKTPADSTDGTGSGTDDAKDDTKAKAGAGTLLCDGVG